MGNTYRDPVDHHRTTQPHAGETLKDLLAWPGLLLVALAVVTFVGGLAAEGYMRMQWAVILGAGALLIGIVGTALLRVESRRVRRIEAQWLAEHQNRPAA